MSQVWELSQADGSARLLLLAIADHANDDGTGAWPSVSALAHKTHISERNVQRLCRVLVDLGELEVHYQAGPFGSNAYTVLIAPVTGYVTPTTGIVTGGDNLSGVTPGAPGGDTGRTGGVTPGAPKPSYEPSIEPSGISPKRAREADGLTTAGRRRVERYQRDRERVITQDFTDVMVDHCTGGMSEAETREQIEMALAYGDPNEPSGPYKWLATNDGLRHYVKNWLDRHLRDLAQRARGAQNYHPPARNGADIFTRIEADGSDWADTKR